MAQNVYDKHKELIANPLGGECSDCGCNADEKCGHCPVNKELGCGITPYPERIKDKARCWCCNRVLGVKKLKRRGRV